MRKVVLNAVVAATALLASSATLAQAETITIAAGNLPPHLDRAGEGREAEIIKTTMKACGYDVKFMVQPFTRHWDTYKRKTDIDAVATVPQGFDMPGFRSVDYVEFHNGITGLAAANINASSLADLAGKRVVGFAGAQDILPGMKEAVPTFASYSEKADQINQSRLLYGGRVDAVLGDGMIFASFAQDLIAQHADAALKFDPTQAISFKATFAPTPYAMVFRDETVQKKFDECFAAEKATIDGINAKYIAKFQDALGNEYLSK